MKKLICDFLFQKNLWTLKCDEQPQNFDFRRVWTWLIDSVLMTGLDHDIFPIWRDVKRLLFDVIGVKKTLRRGFCRFLVLAIDIEIRVILRNKAGNPGSISKLQTVFRKKWSNFWPFRICFKMFHFLWKNLGKAKGCERTFHGFSWVLNTQRVLEAIWAEKS